MPEFLYNMGFLKSRNDPDFSGRDKQELIRQTFTKKFDDFYERLEVYSILFFGLIGFKVNDHYRALEDSGLLPKNTLSANNLYLKYFETLVDNDIDDPLLGVVILNGLRLFSDVYNESRDVTKMNNIFEKLEGKNCG